MEDTIKKERDYSLDLLRIFGALAVVMIHSSCYFMDYDRGSAERIWGAIFEIPSRLGVPLFIMLSGSLLLDENKKISMRDVFFKYVLRTVLLIVFWSAIYTCMDWAIRVYKYKETFSLKYFVVGFMFGYYHMWYLYMLVGMYLITPILKCLCKKENANLVLYYIVLMLIFCCVGSFFKVLQDKISLCYYVNRLIGTLRLDFLVAYVGYFLIGWYLVHVGLSKKIRIWLYALGFVSLILETILSYFSHDFCADNLFMVLYIVAFFVFFREVYKKLFSGFNKFIYQCSKLTFGVYILHPAVLVVFSMFFPYKNGVVLYILVSFLVTTVGSFLITYLLSKIPFIKKIVRV